MWVRMPRRSLFLHFLFLLFSFTLSHPRFIYEANTVEKVDQGDMSLLKRFCIVEDHTSNFCDKILAEIQWQERGDWCQILCWMFKDISNIESNRNTCGRMLDWHDRFIEIYRIAFSFSFFVILLGNRLVTNSFSLEEKMKKIHLFSL